MTRDHYLIMKKLNQISTSFVVHRGTILDWTEMYIISIEDETKPLSEIKWMR